MMKFPKEWEAIERQADQDELIKPKQNKKSSLQGFCLSDFYIIQKWIDYARGIDDQSIGTVSNRPLVFKEIYEMARTRAISVKLKS